MTDLLYTVTGKGSDLNVVAYIDGDLKSASNENPNYEAIVAALEAGDVEQAKALFNPAQVIDEKFQRVTERVTLRGGNVLFDNVVQHSALVDLIVKFAGEGHDFNPLVLFMEKIATNPNEHSREMLFNWLLATGGFGIDPEGDIVGYKGVYHNGDGTFRSGHRGHAFVDGVEIVNDYVPTNPDTVVEMPRDEVQHDPGVGCHTGLHVGTWDYASKFASVTLEVRVNPRDVVSVPTDCGDSKMRVCRYRVLGEVNEPYASSLVEPKQVEGNVQVLEEKTAQVKDVTKAKKVVDNSARVVGNTYTPNSVAIKVIEFYDYDNTLHVELKNGNAYDYKAGRGVFDAWVASDSAGRFYNRKVKGRFNESYCG